MPNLKVGDKFTKFYPFWLLKSDSFLGKVELWMVGCQEHTEDGPEIFEDHCNQYKFYTADAEGFITYTVLAVVDMPGKYKQRILYSVSFINPDGDVSRASDVKTVTITKFTSYIEADHSSFPREYEVEL